MSVLLTGPVERIGADSQGTAGKNIEKIRKDFFLSECGIPTCFVVRAILASSFYLPVIRLKVSERMK